MAQEMVQFPLGNPEEAGGINEQQERVGDAENNAHNGATTEEAEITDLLKVSIIRKKSGALQISPSILA